VPLNLLFSNGFKLIGTSEVKVKCDNILKNNDTIKSAGNGTLFFEVCDGLSCKLSFSHVHCHVKSFQIVCVGNISDEVGNNHVIF
jgi:hypothetical protein